MITRSARKGFSLLELIVVLVVLGLLAAIAIPTYQAVINRTQQRTAISTADAVARNAVALAAFESDPVDGTTLAEAVGETGGEVTVHADGAFGDADIDTEFDEHVDNQGHVTAATADVVLVVGDLLVGVDFSGQLNGAFSTDLLVEVTP